MAYANYIVAFQTTVSLMSYYSNLAIQLAESLIMIARKTFLKPFNLNSGLIKSRKSLNASCLNKNLVLIYAL